MKRRGVVYGVAVVSGACLLAPGCRSPTEITFDVSTDVDCSMVTGTSISVGTLDSLTGKPAATSTTSCDASGHIGSLVVIPSGARDEAVAVQVVVGIGKTPDDCVRDMFVGGCIVARRELNFIPHRPLEVPVEMDATCENIPCSARTTCNLGGCVAPQTSCAESGTCALASVAVVDAGLPPDASEAGAPPAEAGSMPDLDATVDATLDAGGASLDAPAEAAPAPVYSSAPVTLAGVGDVPAASGTPQQQHVFYANHSGRFWFFYIDAANSAVLKTSWSTDFVTWTPGPAMTLVADTAGEGRNFSLAYADLGGRDVVHIAFSHFNYMTNGGETTFHARAVIDGTGVTFGAEAQVSNTVPTNNGANPDGCVTALDTSGNVYQGTGWKNENGQVDTPLNGTPNTLHFDTMGNADVFLAVTPDVGAATWSSSPVAFQYVNWDWVPAFVNDRALVALDGGQMVEVWPSSDVGDEGQGPRSQTIRWSTFVSGASQWTVQGSLFGDLKPTADGDVGAQNSADWNVCKTGGKRIEAVRLSEDGGLNDLYEHRRFDAAAGTWTLGPAIPVEGTTPGAGLVLLTNGSKMLLFALGAGVHTGALRYVEWSGTAWGTWNTFQPGGAVTRAFLSGSGCGDPAHPVLLWTEGTGSSYSVHAAEVGSLF